MGYVTSNLMPDEDIIYAGRVHWFIFVYPFIGLLIGISLFMYSAYIGGTTGETGMVAFVGIGFLIIVLSLVGLLRALIYKLTTELAVTTKRVITKIGFISRKTAELNHNKVESFSINQGITGRLFGFGTLVIHGTGGRGNPFRDIDSPLEFRNQAMKIIDAVSSS